MRRPARRTPRTGRPLCMRLGRQDPPLGTKPPPPLHASLSPREQDPAPGTHPSAPPRPRARDTGAENSSWPGSSRWRRRRGSGRAGGSRQPGTGWWPPSADSVHISGRGSSPAGSGLRTGGGGGTFCPPPRIPCSLSESRSPVRSLRKQLCPRRPAPPRHAPHHRTRLRTSGEPSSALRGGGVRNRDPHGIGTPKGLWDPHGALGPPMA